MSLSGKHKHQQEQQDEGTRHCLPRLAKSLCEKPAKGKTNTCSIGEGDARQG